MKIAVLDEAGDVGATSGASNNFLVVAVVIGNIELLRKVVTRTRKRLDKRRRDISEFKASKTDPRIIRGMLAKIAALDCEIMIVAVDKRKESARDDVESLYRELCAKIARQCVERYHHVTLILDKRYTRTDLTTKLFNVMSEEIEGMDGVLAIEPPRDSERERAIQAVDAVAWSAFQKLEHDDGSFYSLVKERVIWTEGI
ncbi:MAG: DUF3800 domain-containing protein [Chloroflexota bacterium]